MPDQINETERLSKQLDRIEARGKATEDKLDRLLIGHRGDDGLIGRVAKIEHRQTSLRNWSAGIAAAVAALAASLAPGWFRSS